MAMTREQVMAALERAGTAQNRKVYARHGVTGATFGVSYAELGKQKKRIGTDQALAEALWTTGNHDARVLATMIADPALATRALLAAWSRGINNYVITDAFAKLAAVSPYRRPVMEQWTKSKDEWVGAAGWNIAAHLAANEAALPDGYFSPFLATIVKRIHTSKNRVRYAMNGALIAIGLRSPALRAEALAAAAAIGKVVVDHGDTGCKTPDAASYIAKVAARAVKKA